VVADFDVPDAEILAALQVDARRTSRDVAAAVGVAPTTALGRTRALRDGGVITGARLEVDLAAIGRPVQALVAVRVRPPTRAHIERCRSWAATLPETLGVFVTSGTEDFLLHLAVPDVESLYAFVVDRLTSRPEVSDVRTSVVYEHLPSNVLPPSPTRRPRA